MGFGFLFKLEESSVERHKDERKVRDINDATSVDPVDTLTENMEDVEINVEDGDSSEDEISVKDENNFEVLKPIVEEGDNSNERESGESIEEEKEEPVVNMLNNESGEIKTNNEVKNEDLETANVLDNKDGNATSKTNNDAEVEFPDTDVKIGFDRLGSVEIKTRTVSESEEVNSVKPSGRGQPAWKLEQQQKKNGKNKNDKKEEPKSADANNQNIRGKKGKMKKIKEKYKDQDEEERELRMKLLKSQGNKEKEENNKKNKKETKSPYASKTSKSVTNRPKKPDNTDRSTQDHDVEKEEKPANDETDMLDSLTGIPVAEDEILFAIPVCGPYNTLLNYKYKVLLVLRAQFIYI